MGIAASKQEAFWEACGFGHTEIVKKFLEDKEINVNWVSYAHDSCAIHVAAHGKLEIVKLLLKANCDVNARDIHGCIALHHAAMTGHTDIVEALLKGGSMIDAQDKNDWTPLTKAAYFCQPDVVDFLLEKKCDVVLKNSDGRAALHEACRSHSTDEEGLGRIAKGLIAAGSDLNSKSLDVGITKAEFTPLMFCGYHGHTKIAEALIDAGCDINAQGSNGWTALHWAADRGKKETAELLLKAGVDPLLEGDRGELCCNRALQSDLRSLLRKAVDEARRKAGLPPQTDTEDLLKAMNEAIAAKSLQNRALAIGSGAPLTPEEIHALDRRSPVSTNDGSDSDRSLPSSPEVTRRETSSSEVRQNPAAEPQRPAYIPLRLRRKPRKFPGMGDAPAPKAEPEDEGDIAFADEDDEEAPSHPPNGYISHGANAFDTNGVSEKSVAQPVHSEYDDLDDIINEDEYEDGLHDDN